MRKLREAVRFLGVGSLDFIYGFGKRKKVFSPPPFILLAIVLLLECPSDLKKDRRLATKGLCKENTLGISIVQGVRVDVL